MVRTVCTVEASCFTSSVELPTGSSDSSAHFTGGRERHANDRGRFRAISYAKDQSTSMET